MFLIDPALGVHVKIQVMRFLSHYYGLRSVNFVLRVQRGWALELEPPPSFVRSLNSHSSPDFSSDLQDNIELSGQA